MQETIGLLNAPGGTVYFWIKKIKAFEALKTVVAKEPILKKWCPELPTRVETNTFNSITGGVLSQ